MDNVIKTSADALEDDVLPKMRAANAAGTQDEKLPSVMTQAVSKKSPAQWAYERVVLYLKKFEETLDAEHEAAMGFAGGDAGVLRIEGMGYFDPDIVTFYGTDAVGAQTQLVQHVTQLNVMLRVIPKEVDAPEPNRIGFRLAEQLERPVA